MSCNIGKIGCIFINLKESTATSHKDRYLYGVIKVDRGYLPVTQSRLKIHNVITLPKGTQTHLHEGVHYLFVTSDDPVKIVRGVKFQIQRFTGIFHHHIYIEGTGGCLSYILISRRR